MSTDYDRAVKAETERDEALGKLDASRVVETALRRHVSELELAIDGLIRVVTEANLGEHAWDCPASGKTARIASCDCGHPEGSSQVLKANAVLAAARTLRR